MSIQTRNRIIGVLLVAILLLIGVGALETWGYFRLHLEAAFAEEQTRVFDEARTKALESDAAGAAGLLEYVVIYYPSGSKQRTGSHLDLVVERHRDIVIQDIIRHLREKTGEDLGDKPEVWVQKYDKK